MLVLVMYVFYVYIDKTLYDVYYEELISLE